MPLTVSIGSSRDPSSFQRCVVNKETEPVFVSSEHFEGLITVRIQNHQPAVPEAGATSCSYFDHHSRIFSLQWQGRFKATNRAHPNQLWTADEVLFVAEVEHSIRPPMGLSIATRFVRLIDPSFFTDAVWNRRRPWVGSFLVTGMNVLRVWDPKRGQGSDDQNEEGLREKEEVNGRGSVPSRVGQWNFFGTNRLQEANVEMMMEQQRQGSVFADAVKGLSSYQRRRFFMAGEHRQAAMFDPRLVFGGDFFNNFTNFETRRASMMVTIRMERVLKDQPLRFVCRSRPREQRERSEVTGAVAVGGGSQREDKDDDDQVGDEEVVFFVVQLDWDASS